jgi:hypothetical protein
VIVPARSWALTPDVINVMLARRRTLRTRARHMCRLL